MVVSDVVTGDMREVLKSYPASRFGACVVDPPYEYNFMNNVWDATGVSIDKRTWRAVYRVLKPGAWLFCFGGTRTFHRIGVAIEDAGFEMRGAIAWIHGQGYPKNVHIKRALQDEKPSRTKRVDPERWEGFGTALKPAHEPILLARKPVTGTILDTIERFGTGALNIDASRIPTDAEIADHPQGRFPADVILDPEMAALLDDQAGARGGGVGVAWGGSRAHVYHAEGKRSLDKRAGTVMGYSDEGGPSRFFYVAKPTVSERDLGLDALPDTETHRYGAGIGEGLDPDAPAVGKNMHPTVKPVLLMRYLVRMATPPGEICLDPFLGSGTTGVACAMEGIDFVGIELDPAYTEIARLRIAHALGGN